MYVRGSNDGEEDCTPAEIRERSVDVVTSDARRFGIRTVSRVFDPATYRWPSPASCFVEHDAFTERLQRFYTDIARKSCPASTLLELENVTLARNVIYCTAGYERRALYETARANDRAATTPAGEEELRAADRTRFADEDWNYLFIGSAGSFNYGHWLVDDLPRAKAAAALLHNGSRPLRILIPSYGETIDRIRVCSLRQILRAEVHVDLVDPMRAQFVPRLFYATPVTDHPIAKSPIAIDYAARETVSSLYAAGSIQGDGRSRRLFVRRRGVSTRILRDEDELIARLAPAGFKAIDPVGLGFVEQARAFAQASFVVGAMGAAMVNTLFCRPCTPVFYLAPRGWIEPFYFDLAVVRGQDYHVLYGTPHDETVEPHLSDFNVDQELVVQRIKAIAGEE